MVAVFADFVLEDIPFICSNSHFLTTFSSGRYGKYPTRTLPCHTPWQTSTSHSPFNVGRHRIRSLLFPPFWRIVKQCITVHLVLNRLCIFFDHPFNNESTNNLVLLQDTQRRPQLPPFQQPIFELELFYPPPPSRIVRILLVFGLRTANILLSYIVQGVSSTLDGFWHISRRSSRNGGSAHRI